MLSVYGLRGMASAPQVAFARFRFEDDGVSS